jgi:hypothetical protein
MRDVNIVFGINAGKIWRTLDSSGPLTKIQLMDRIELEENELFRAIGWLARENKINKEGEFYKLDDTNLSDMIEKNAEVLYRIFKNGKLDVNNLEKITKLDEETYNLSLGWLAREDRLENDILI